MREAAIPGDPIVWDGQQHQVNFRWENYGNGLEGLGRVLKTELFIDGKLHGRQVRRGLAFCLGTLEV